MSALLLLQQLITNLKPLRKYVFPNGTKKIYYAPWVINKAQNRVTLSETSGEVKIKFTRSFAVSRLGDGIIYATSSDDSIAKVSVSGNTVTITGVTVGDVTITVSVAEGTNCLATSTTYACKSRKTQITVPTVSNTSQAYHGYSLHPTVTNEPSTSLVTRTGTYSATAYSPTPYSFTYTIKDTDAYEWSDGTTAPKTYSWRINKAVFPIPAQVGTAYYNDGYAVLPTWNFSSYTNKHLIQITNGTGTTVGTYTATFHLPDIVNCQWSDGTTTDKTAQFYISKRAVAVPSQRGSLVWNGNNQLPDWNNYDENLMTVSGNSSASAGNHNATFTLKDSANNCWSDGVTSANHTAKWTMNWLEVGKPYLANSSLTYNDSL